MNRFVPQQSSPHSVTREKVTLREKELIVGHYMENNSMALTVKIVKMSKNIVWRVIKRFNDHNSLETR